MKPNKACVKAANCVAPFGSAGPAAWRSGKSFLTPFAARHPKLNVQILLDDKRRDLVREAVDVAIRVGRLADSRATARLIAKVTRVVIASPSYLRAGTPTSPAESSQHRIIGGRATLVPNAWAFERDGKTETPELSPHISTNDNGLRSLVCASPPRSNGPAAASCGTAGHLVDDQFTLADLNVLPILDRVVLAPATAHGGRLWAEANEPRGAVFQFTLPNGSAK
jgi:DNA-binding transcriptional LysR family regulator